MTDTSKLLDAVIGSIADTLQDRRNADPQWKLPPSPETHEAAHAEAERAEFDRDNEGERFDGGQ